MTSAPTFRDRRIGLLTGATLSAAIRDAFARLDPRVQLRNPLTIGLYAGAIFTTISGAATAVAAQEIAGLSALHLAIAAWLWLSLLLANFAEVVAIRQGMARGAQLRAIRPHVHAKRVLDRNRRDYHLVEADALRNGNTVLVEANDIIPADGTVTEGTAYVSEGAVTGESAPVLRAAGQEASSVRAGTRVLSDWLVVRVRSREGFFDPMVTIPEGKWRLSTRQEIALSIVLATATIMFLLGITTLAPFAHSADAGMAGVLAVSVLAALTVCVIPIVIRALLAAIGAVGMQRLMHANVIANASASVEAAGLVDILVLDKTGTITVGDRHAVAFHAVPGIPEPDLVDVAHLASLADETPEGRSIVALARQLLPKQRLVLPTSEHSFHKFSAQTCISGVDQEGRSLRKGAAYAVRHFVEDQGGSWSSTVSEMVDKVARSGATALVVADGARILGIVELRDVVKFGIRERCEALRQMGIRTIMVTGDNRLTAMAIAADVGVDDFLAEATPGRKLELIRRLQKEGRRVAMCGDGKNDAPALAQADLAVVMNTGTPLAKDVGDMVDLDSNPAKFIQIAQTGRQVLKTRRVLTTFSIATEIGKYLVILGAALSTSLPQLYAFDVMRLASPSSAILSAAVFGSLYVMILALLALRRAKTSPTGAVELPRRSLLFYGLGGILIPFASIKVIDTGLALMHLL